MNFPLLDRYSLCSNHSFELMHFGHSDGLQACLHVQHCGLVSFFFFWPCTLCICDRPKQKLPLLLLMEILILPLIFSWPSRQLIFYLTNFSADYFWTWLLSVISFWMGAKMKTIQIGRDQMLTSLSLATQLPFEDLHLCEFTLPAILRGGGRDVRGEWCWEMGSGDCKQCEFVTHSTFKLIKDAFDCSFL